MLPLRLYLLYGSLKKQGLLPYKTVIMVVYNRGGECLLRVNLYKIDMVHLQRVKNAIGYYSNF